MIKPLNQHGLRINIGEGVVYAENRISLRNEEGERCVPVGTSAAGISMPHGKDEGRTFPRVSPACLAVYTKNDRRNIDIDICTLKGGGEYSLKSSIQHTYQPKFQMEKKKP